MTTAPREAKARIGPIGALLCRVLFVAICLPGPIMLSDAVSQDPWRSPAHFWGMLAGDVLATVVGGGFAVVGWRLVTRSRRDARRLAVAGVAATAEILAVANHLSGEESGLKLHLRINGPGFATFDAETIRAQDPALVPGVLLAAIVDPEERVFSVA